jgi:hypothetical protein
MSALPPKADMVRHDGDVRFSSRGDRSLCGEAARAIAEAVIRSVELLVRSAPKTYRGDMHRKPKVECIIIR